MGAFGTKLLILIEVRIQINRLDNQQPGSIKEKIYLDSEDHQGYIDSNNDAGFLRSDPELR
jgi:hypothetical protein